jgi:hypothetical protein
MKKTIFYLFLGIIFIACKKIKLDENENKYKEKELQKMLEGDWTVTEYLIDGTSYLDTFFKVNPTGNCKTYKFTQWKNSGTNKSDKDYSTGKFYGDCFTNLGKGYEFLPKNKSLKLGSYNCFIDSVKSFEGLFVVEVLKLENNELILQDNEENIIKRISFKKQ